jgi:hypothetical protein
MSDKCSSCKKPFTFNPAITQKGETKVFAGQAEVKVVIYYPSCPHCNKTNVVRESTLSR